VIPQKSARPREAGGLDEGALEILRSAQDDTTPGCHPEQSEGSLADFWGITRKEYIEKLKQVRMWFSDPFQDEKVTRIAVLA
jgi:hypothetical protein